ncbi:MAG: hypothetical protein ACMUIP_00575 [bacterium]
MKKLIMLSLVIILALSIIGATPVLAESKGAVKQPVVEQSIRKGFSGPEKGKVIINSSANGMLNVVVQLKGAIQDTDLTAGLCRTDTWEKLGEGRMTTNGQGNASVNIKYQIPSDLVNASSMSVQLSVYTLNPTTPVYWSSYIEVPIK